MDQPSVDEKSWPTTCPECGTELQHGTLDFDQTNRPDPEFQAGEMAMVDFCPNPDCPANADTATDASTASDAPDATG